MSNTQFGTLLIIVNVWGFVIASKLRTIILILEGKR